MEVGGPRPVDEPQSSVQEDPVQPWAPRAGLVVPTRRCPQCHRHARCRVHLPPVAAVDGDRGQVVVHDHCGPVPGRRPGSQVQAGGKWMPRLHGCVGRGTTDAVRCRVDPGTGPRPTCPKRPAITGERRLTDPSCGPHRQVVRQAAWWLRGGGERWVSHRGRGGPGPSSGGRPCAGRRRGRRSGAGACGRGDRPG